MVLRRSLALLAVAVSAAGLVGCSGRNEMTNLPKPSQRFCDAAAKYEASITGGKKPAGIATQVELVRKMDAAAPKDIADSTSTFLRALERVQAGDTTAVDSAAVRAAVTDVNRRYSQGCGVYDRRGGI